MNTQQIEQPIKSNGNTLDVVAIWQTIQGEGPLAGRPATFIRMAGCNLCCPLCDSDYTKSRRLLTLEQIVNLCKQHGHKLIVITGGEPFRQNILELIAKLHSHEFIVQVETNGVLSPFHCDESEEFSRFLLAGNLYKATVVCSPKTSKISKEMVRFIDAYKYIISAGKTSKKDGLPRGSLGYDVIPFRPPDDFPKHMIYVQPCMDENYQDNLEHTVDDIVMQFGYTLSLQTHKIIGVE